MTRKRIETFLQIADEEYAAACKLQLLLPRQGAYFLQQSVEKLIRPRGPLVAEFSHASRKGQSVECFGGASSATENL